MLTLRRCVCSSAILAITAAAYADLGDQLSKLLPDDGAEHDNFGISVAISDAITIVGAELDDDNGSNSGSAYLFDISEPANPTQLFKLLPDDGAAIDRFGISVAISGPPGNEVAIVGAWQDDDNGTGSGSAYLFDTTTGQQLFKLLPTDGAAGDWFGISVAISGTTAVVGVRNDDDNGESSGSAYLFDTVTRLQVAKLLPNDGAEGDNFGYSVAISGTTAVVGAYGNDDNGNSSGSAYLFDATGASPCPRGFDGNAGVDCTGACCLPDDSCVEAVPQSECEVKMGGIYAGPVTTCESVTCPFCPADLNGDGLVNTTDLTLLLGAWVAGTAGGDIDGDGDTDSTDLTLLLMAWVAGVCV